MGAKVFETGNSSGREAKQKNASNEDRVSLTFRLDFCKLRLSFSQLKLLVMPSLIIQQKKWESPSDHL